MKPQLRGGRFKKTGDLSLAHSHKRLFRPRHTSQVALSWCLQNTLYLEYMTPFLADSTEWKEATIQQRRNERNHVISPQPLTNAELLVRKEECQKRATACFAEERLTDLSIDELEHVFRHLSHTSGTKASALGVVARVSSAWRHAASELRHDLLWQLSNLTVIDGVPEAFHVPYSKPILSRWISTCPGQAVAFLSIRQLRAAGALPELVAQRLDYDDGLTCRVLAKLPGANAFNGTPTRKSVLSTGMLYRSIFVMTNRSQVRSRLEGKAAASGVEVSDLLPLRCTLDAHESASGELSVNVEGRHVGYVASRDAALIVSGEARIVSVDRFGECWRLRALPRP